MAIDKPNIDGNVYRDIEDRIVSALDRYFEMDGGPGIALSRDEAVAHLLRVLNSEIWKEEMDTDALALVLGAVEDGSGGWAIPDRYTITEAGRALLAEVGDIDSDAKGTGARYNGGKVPLELLPLRVAGMLLLPATKAQEHVLKAVVQLGMFQSREPGGSDHLMLALEATAKAAGLDTAELLDEAAWVLDYGRGKYKAWNWAKGMPWSVCLACVARHLLRHMWQDPEGRDEESGRLHAGHVAANILFLAQYILTYREGDDRPEMLAVATSL